MQIHLEPFLLHKRGFTVHFTISVPCKMELKLMSECDTEDTSQLKDTRRWNLNRLITHVAIYVHFNDCTSAQIKKTQMEPQVASTSKFFFTFAA